MSLETLLVIVAVVVAAVFNILLPWLKKLQGDGLAGNAEPELQEAPTTVLAPVQSASPAPAPAPEFATRRNAPTRSAAPTVPAVARPARRSPVAVCRTCAMGSCSRRCSARAVRRRRTSDEATLSPRVAAPEEPGLVRKNRTIDH